MTDSPFAINHLLKSKGLSALDQAGELVSQLGHLVRDHTHLRSLINACDPAERRNMYEALSPSLTFKPKPLWEYELEMRMDAEARQLPVIGEGGKLEPFKVAEVQTLSDASAEILAKEHLALVCVRCTFEQVFHGMSKAEVIRLAREAGWKQRKRNGKREAGCPQCMVANRQRQN